ncbi:Oxoglutarate/iron-dependent dioxygenase [Macleaya cordata]|uniref:Oxoglutarate/iron-dependent dioxygenase n=1 Tax=Macleaya cordata TaxID=56857 RepID=A0A200PN81_MACCD|nr:Oxoglutarate/iron-dependent dioxygenase [Macleaya cordata]
MGASKSTLHKLPIVDFTRDELNPGTDYWFSVRTKELFDLPLETKIQNTYEKPYFGYVGQTSVRPLHEGMGIDDAPIHERVQNFTNLMWPEGNDNFCEIVHSYATRVTELEQMVTRMVFESYGVEKHYNSHIESMNYLLRVLKYRTPQANETNLGATPHTDKTFITILHQNHVNGLEVQTKNGKWISVKPAANSFVVMTGDAFMAWSNGRLRSPHHRVVMKGKDMRYSIGLFTFNRKLVEVPKELVDEEHPLQFKPFCQMGLINFLSTEEGQKAESTVKAYCGIQEKRNIFNVLRS